MNKTYDSIVFNDHLGQAVRLPQAIALPEHVERVEIVVVGDTLIITQAGRSWDQWFDSPGAAADFMTERDQPRPQERESVDD